MSNEAFVMDSNDSPVSLDQNSTLITPKPVQQDTSGKTSAENPSAENDNDRQNGNELKSELKFMFTELREYKTQKKNYYSDNQIKVLICDVEQRISSVKELFSLFPLASGSQIGKVHRQEEFNGDIENEAKRRHERLINPKKQKWWHTLNELN